MKMLCCALGAAAVLSPGLCMAQTTTAPKTTKAWDPSAHYRKRCGQMEEALKALTTSTQARVVLLGDSITEKNPMKDAAGMVIVNMGISGDRIDNPSLGTGVRRRLELVAKAQAKHVFLMIGVNDFWGGKKPVEQARADYTALLQALREAAPGVTLHVQSVLPTAGKNAYLLPDIRQLNEHIRQLAIAQDIDYVDLWPAMADGKGELKAEFTGDGVHLTPAGYDAWNRIIASRLGASDAKQ